MLPPPPPVPMMPILKPSQDVESQKANLDPHCFLSAGQLIRLIRGHFHLACCPAPPLVVMGGPSEGCSGQRTEAGTQGLSFPRLPQPGPETVWKPRPARPPGPHSSASVPAPRYLRWTAKAAATAGAPPAPITAPQLPSGGMHEATCTLVVLIIAPVYGRLCVHSLDM
ncbi:unnamed protein product [Gadus morhua 'NCC']